MKVGVIQSNYIPWRGYFDFIASVDLFIIYDDVQFTKNDWRNRNKFRVHSGHTKWLTIPVQPGKSHKLVNETLVDTSRNWRADHLNMFTENYKKAPYFQEASELFASCLEEKSNFLSAINMHAIRDICAYFSISTKIVRSEEFYVSGAKNDRLMELLVRAKATHYLSGPSAAAYLDKEMFRRHGIELAYKSYSYTPYKQVHGEFEPAVSILDLIANHGPSAYQYLRSIEPDLRIIVQEPARRS